MPFTCMVVGLSWASTHSDLLHHVLAATDRSIAWFADPSHRAEALDVLVKVGKATPEDAEASYDFLRRIEYFESGDKVSRQAAGNVMEAERSRGLVSPGLTVDRLVLSGVAAMAE